MTPQSPPLPPANFDVQRRHALLDFGLKLALLAAAFIVFTGSIYVGEKLGDATGIPRFGIAGLALDVIVLGAIVIRLTIRRHPLAAALGPVLALLIVVLFFAVADTWLHGDRARFWSLRNLRTVAMQASPIAVAALGMTLIIIAGGIDLSAGTALSLSATVLAYCLVAGSSIYMALAACIATGCIAGLLNGLLISSLRVVPFIITLGTMTTYLGAAKILAKQETIRPPLERIPDWLPALVTPSPSLEWLSWPLLPNFASGVWLALVLAVFTALLLHLTVFGRHVFAIGSNEATARLCGINVPTTKIAVYTLAGLFTGIAGIYQFARLSSGNPDSGVGLELKIIAAVVIGGGSLSGGQGSVVGTLTGAAIMLVIASGCTQLGMQNATQDIIIGVIIVAAVTLDQIRQGKLGVGKWWSSMTKPE